ncbi:phage holin [Staphylococcus chromogenes]|uniref:phage holin n=1 Tax=Staphylococcus chromogenes TaxID=46126 RepID=UPI00188E6385|nr:phage holin [Staphylococcus chromogenes]
MKINWKLRLQNKSTLTALIGLFFVLLKQIGEMFGVDFTTQIEQLSGMVGTILTALGLLGVITDPTTKGVSDTGIVQTYQKPRDSKNEDEQLEWQAVAAHNAELVRDAQEKELPTFDTSQPFTDDDDDVVEFDEQLYTLDQNDAPVTPITPDNNTQGIEGGVANGSTTD